MHSQRLLIWVLPLIYLVAAAPVEFSPAHGEGLQVSVLQWKGPVVDGGPHIVIDGTLQDVYATILQKVDDPSFSLQTEVEYTGNRAKTPCPLKQSATCTPTSATARSSMEPTSQTIEHSSATYTGPYDAVQPIESVTTCTLTHVTVGPSAESTTCTLEHVSASWSGPYDAIVPVETTIAMAPFNVNQRDESTTCTLEHVSAAWSGPYDAIAPIESMVTQAPYHPDQQPSSTTCTLEHVTAGTPSPDALNTYSSSWPTATSTSTEPAATITRTATTQRPFRTTLATSDAVTKTVVNGTKKPVSTLTRIITAESTFRATISRPGSNVETVNVGVTRTRHSATAAITTLTSSKAKATTTKTSTKPYPHPTHTFDGTCKLPHNAQPADQGISSDSDAEEIAPIEDGIRYLKDLGNGTATCGVAARSCARISCSWEAAIYLCNENDHHIAPKCYDLGAKYAQWIQYHCIDYWNKVGGITFNHAEKWSIRVQADKINC